MTTQTVSIKLDRVIQSLKELTSEELGIVLEDLPEEILSRLHAFSGYVLMDRDMVAGKRVGP